MHNLKKNKKWQKIAKICKSIQQQTNYATNMPKHAKVKKKYEIEKKIYHEKVCKSIQRCVKACKNMLK